MKVPSGAIFTDSWHSYTFQGQRQVFDGTGVRFKIIGVVLQSRGSASLPPKKKDFNDNIKIGSGH